MMSEKNFKKPNDLKEIYDFRYFSFVTVSGDVHIIPYQPNEERKHIANKGCWCIPVCQDIDEKTNQAMYAHHPIQ